MSKPEEVNEAARLSALLFFAREQISMWADVVRAQTGREPVAVVRLRDSIDEYRAEKGWDPNGFGHESPTQVSFTEETPSVATGIFPDHEDQRG